MAAEVDPSANGDPQNGIAGFSFFCNSWLNRLVRRRH